MLDEVLARLEVDSGTEDEAADLLLARLLERQRSVQPRDVGAGGYLGKDSSKEEQYEQRVRHVCGISGGKDSSALAVYLRDRVPTWSTSSATPALSYPRPTNTSTGSRSYSASRSPAQRRPGL